MTRSQENIDIVKSDKPDDVEIPEDVARMLVQTSPLFVAAIFDVMVIHSPPKLKAAWSLLKTGLFLPLDGPEHSLANLDIFREAKKSIQDIAQRGDDDKQTTALMLEVLGRIDEGANSIFGHDDHLAEQQINDVVMHLLRLTYKRDAPHMFMAIFSFAVQQRRLNPKTATDILTDLFARSFVTSAIKIAGWRCLKSLTDAKIIAGFDGFSDNDLIMMLRDWASKGSVNIAQALELGLVERLGADRVAECIMHTLLLSTATDEHATSCLQLSAEHGLLSLEQILPCFRHLYTQKLMRLDETQASATFKAFSERFGAGFEDAMNDPAYKTSFIRDAIKAGNLKIILAIEECGFDPSPAGVVRGHNLLQVMASTKECTAEDFDLFFATHNAAPYFNCRPSPALIAERRGDLHLAGRLQAEEAHCGVRAALTKLRP